MVIDPVCKMALEPVAATASTVFEGRKLYFCSELCYRRFLASPAAYEAASRPTQTADVHCKSLAGQNSERLGPAVIGTAVVAGLAGTMILLAIYLSVLTLVSGWSFTTQQLVQFWPYIMALSAGFGIQVGLFAYLRRAAHMAASGKVVAATGTTSGVAMVSCCAHYLVNLLPALGATGLVSLIGSYQIELFWLGIAANLAGIAYVGRRLITFTIGA